MKIVVYRKTFGPEATIGEMHVDGVFECFTLEDVVRPAGAAKVYGQTAIPAGKYPVIINKSNRFQRLLPLVQNVPNFDGIRIHSGNTSANTEGCILVGTTKVGPDFIGNSRVAFDALFKKMQSAKGPITIEVRN